LTRNFELARTRAGAAARCHALVKGLPFAALLSLTAALAGCGSGGEGATFQKGPGESPLDQAVIMDDGHSILLRLTLDLDSLASATISGNGQASAIRFDTPASGVVVPREIETASGESIFSIDRTAGQMTFEAIAPQGIGPMALTASVPDDFVATRSFLMPEDRSPAHAADCDEVVESAREFCDRYESNRDASITEVTALALEMAQSQLDAPTPTVFIEETVRQHYEVLDIFCNGFTEVVDGTPDKAAVDICADVREEEGDGEEGEGGGP
jgi:hypothetical protein